MSTRNAAAGVGSAAMEHDTEDDVAVGNWPEPVLRLWEQS